MIKYILRLFYYKIIVSHLSALEVYRQVQMVVSI